jgi:hypothetical protein
VASDESVEYPYQLLASGLHRELAGVIKLVEILELDPTNQAARVLLDGPLLG